MHAIKMTSLERRAVVSLSSIMSLRMIGLFMVLPVFTLYTQQLTGATPALIGVGMGIYGLSQALFQIPLGALSDHVGRKPIILIGLLIFIIGSLIAGLTESIWGMIIGRALQGMGAVGSTLLALIADHTRESERTKAMAISGMTIGFSFLLAMLLGPLLTQWMPVNRLFLIAALMGGIGIGLLMTWVPTPQHTTWHRDAEPELASFFSLLKNIELIKLNSGIFILHAIFTATFVVLPLSLRQFTALPLHHQWLLYVPALLVAFVATLVCVGIAESKQKVKPFFIGSILALLVAEISWWRLPAGFALTAISLCLFFAGFSILEAFLPSLVSRTAPATRKGSALGVYSCAQFLGIFVGGVLGGWLFGLYSYAGVYIFCTMLAICWLVLTFFMQPPRFLVTQLWRISPSEQPNWPHIAEKLHAMPGIIEVTFMADEGVAYLKMERSTARHPDFLRLKIQLQPEAAQ